MAFDYRSAYFEPGAVDDALEFASLLEGNEYRFTFTATGDVGAHFVLRPGGVDDKNDIVIGVKQAYDETFTVQPGGNVRFLCTDISGVTRITLTDMYIYTVSEVPQPESGFVHDFADGIGPFTHTRAGNATVTQPDGTVDLLGPDEEGIVEGVGLQIEAASTNYMTYSESGTGWSDPGGIVTSSTEISPSGSANAMRMYNVSGTNPVRKPITAATPDVAVAWSWFYKVIQDSGTGILQARSNQDWTLGTYDLDPDLIGSEWTRIHHAHPAVTNVQHPMTNSASAAGGPNHYVSRENFETDSWGWQWEENPSRVPTSYIPTSGSAQMRDPVVVNLDLTAPDAPIALPSGTDFSVQFVYTNLESLGTGSELNIFHITGEGATDSFLRIRMRISGQIVFRFGGTGGTQDHFFTPTTPAEYGEDNDIRVRLSMTEGMNIWVNGEEVLNAIMPIAPTIADAQNISILRDLSSGAKPKSGIVKKIRILDYAEDWETIKGWT